MKFSDFAPRPASDYCPPEISRSACTNAHALFVSHTLILRSPKASPSIAAIAADGNKKPALRRVFRHSWISLDELMEAGVGIEPASTALQAAA